MKKSYILSSGEFEALAAKEGMKSCLLFEKRPENGSEKASEDGKKQWSRHDEISIVFRLIQKKMISCTENGMETDENIKQIFALLREAPVIITAESSLMREQPCCLYTRETESVLLSVPETNPDSIRMTKFQNLEEPIEEMLRMYTLTEENSLMEKEETEEVPFSERIGKEGAVRWIEWKRHKSMKRDQSRNDENEMALLYTESRCGMELSLRRGLNTDAWYYTKKMLMELLREMMFHGSKNLLSGKDGHSSE